MTPPVRAALVNILELFNQGKLELVTSDLSKGDRQTEFRAPI
jgi:hypothetical protein